MSKQYTLDQLQAMEEYQLNRAYGFLTGSWANPASDGEAALKLFEKMRSGNNCSIEFDNGYMTITTTGEDLSDPNGCSDRTYIDVTIPATSVLDIRRAVTIAFILIAQPSV